MKAYFTSAQRPETRQRIKQLVDAGLQQKGPVELNLGKYVGESSHG
jgi:hypothetical protein